MVLYSILKPLPVHTLSPNPSMIGRVPESFQIGLRMKKITPLQSYAIVKGIKKCRYTNKHKSGLSPTDAMYIQYLLIWRTFTQH